MGSGASLDHGGSGSRETAATSGRFFCHACGRIFTMSSGYSANTNCLQCQSSFLEELDGNSNMINSASALNSSLLSSNILNNEQSRRLANAAIMLRLLEIQLRDELNSLQNAFASNIVRRTEEKVKPMTIVVLQKLCKRPLSLDMMCSQPSCPVCSDELALGSMVTLLPCSHFFHEACVMPWLEVKRNCPICRYEITDSVPSIEELEKFTEIELREKLLILSAPLLAKEGDLCYTKGNLAALLHQALKDKKDVLDSVDGGAAMGGRTVQSRIYPSEGMTGLGPRSSPGSGGPSATSVGVARATAAGGRESLIYLSRQIEQAREMMPYQHRHILFGSQTAEASNHAASADNGRRGSSGRPLNGGLEIDRARAREHARIYGMEEMSMSGSATHPPAGISQAFLAALAARGRPPAPGSGSGPYNNPNVGEVVGSTGHNVGLSAVNGSDSSSALAQNGRGRDVEPYPSSSYSPAVHRTATISPLNPTPAVTSSMSELD